VGKNRKLASLAVIVIAGVTGAVASAAPAYAAVETETVTTNVVDRDDHGHGSPPPAVWAKDTFTRTVTITGPDEESTSPVACNTVDSLWTYHAVVADNGTFVTVAGPTLSPNAGAALAGDVPGTMTGGFTVDFTAAAHWCSFDPSDLDGQTLKGDATPSTPGWVKSMFSDFEGVEGMDMNDDWGWTYKTCVEQWWDAADPASDDGQTDAAGDITGTPCPPASPEPSLPITGTSLSTVIGGGAALIIVGGMLVLLAFRRRRVRA
jgi:LPXTG cell wall anchor motif